MSRRSCYGKTRALCYPSTTYRNRSYYLLTCRYLFGQAVVAGREVEQADMAIDGGGAVGGYGAQDRGEAEVLGEWNLLPVAFSLALDGVLLSVVHIVVVGVDNPRQHHRVGLREVFVSDDDAQGVRTGHGLGAVGRLFRICHRLPCCWTT